MEEIGIKKPSSKVLAKMVKGLPFRIQNGDEMSIAVNKTKLRKIGNAFRKMKGITVSLSPNEVMKSREIVGTGIFGKKFDKLLDNVGKATGVPAKQIAYRFGDEMKPAVKAAVRGALTAGGVALASAAPEAIPVIPLMVNGGAYVANSFLDDPSSFGVGKGLYATRGRGLYAGGALYASKIRGRGANKRLLNQQFSVKEAGDFLGKELPNAIQGKGVRAIDQKFSVKDGVHMFSKEIPRAFGGGQLQRNIPDNEFASIGLGGTLLSDREQHQALQSQPFATNYNMANSLPPSYQKYHQGSY